MRLVSLALLSALAAPVFAQQQPAPAAGTITGTILCADTGRPARFAMVALYPADSTTRASATNVLQAATNPHNEVAGLVPTHTALDGSFIFTEVPRGLYFISVGLDGYFNPTDAFPRDQLQSPDPDTRKLVLASVPSVSIADNGSARLDLRIERAAAISGRILYDDGSPAGKWQITARPADPDSKAKIVGDGMTVTYTDDRGNFRLPSVPAGTYVIKADFEAVFLRGNTTSIQSRRFALSVYSGGTLHPADATLISVTAGEERSGVDMTVPIHDLHTISGVVTAKSDGHPVNSGFVHLTSSDDKHFDFQTAIDNSGTFIFYYLPANTTYTLRVDAQESIPYAPGTAPVQIVNGAKVIPFARYHRYDQVKQEVRLNDSDLTGIAVSVPEAAVAPTK